MQGCLPFVQRLVTVTGHTLQQQCQPPCSALCGVQLRAQTQQDSMPFPHPNALQQQRGCCPAGRCLAKTGCLAVCLPAQGPGFKDAAGVAVDDEGLQQQQDRDSQVQLMSSLPAVRTPAHVDTAMPAEHDAAAWACPRPAECSALTAASALSQPDR